MSAFKKILCATDLSEASAAVVRQAADIARQSDAELVVMHVARLLAFPGVYGVPVDFGMAYESEVEGNIRKHLDPMLREFEADGVRVSLQLPWSINPAETVCETAGKGGFDLVVIGSHSHGALTAMLLGSTAERILRRCPCSVLAIRVPGAKPA